MDLKPSPEYKKFREEIKLFLKDNLKMVMRHEQYPNVMEVLEQNLMCLNQEL